MTTAASLLVGGADGWHNGDQQITYSFHTDVPPYDAETDNDGDGTTDGWDLGNGEYLPFDAFEALTAAERTLAHAAVAAWNQVANVNLSFQASGIGDVTFSAGRFAEANVYGFAEFPGTPGVDSQNGDVWLNNTNTLQTAAALGNTGWSTYLHELGHALGLHHPDEDPDNAANSPDNNNQWTVMSYVAHPGVQALPDLQQSYPLTPMLYDIQAIQTLYGANLASRTGNTTYVSGPGAVYALGNGGGIAGGYKGIFTIWDAGGIDVINAANQTSAVTISLVPGTFSTIGTLANNVAVAFEVNVRGVVVNYIENAIGGTGSDTLTGNAAANALTGGDGNDTLNGGDGDDVLDGGAGNDIFNGGAGNDGMRAGGGSDAFNGGAGGADFVNFAPSTGARIFLDGSGTNGQAAVGDTFTGIENLIGSTTGADWLVGDGAANRFVGNGGADILWGRGGADQLEGGDGFDRLWGGAGNDVLVGGAGNDVFVFGDSAAGGGFDRITDFTDGQDRLEIDASMFGGGLVAGGTVQLRSGATPNSTAAVGGVFLYDTDNGYLSWDADGAGAGAAVLFLRLQNLPALDTGDFLVVA